MKQSWTAASLWICLVVTLLTSSCTTSPTGRNQLVLVSEEQMAAMGNQAFQQMKEQQQVESDTGASRYVNCVASAITRAVPGGYQWEVAVFDEDAVNAFALPGGKIGVYKGILGVAGNQNQLAGVVSHEVAHVIARHHAARVSSQLATQLGVSVAAGSTGLDPKLINMGADLLMTLPYSRADETEADQLGLTYMAEAGFDPRETIELWRNMAEEAGSRPPEFASTHPSPQSRIDDLRDHMPGALQTYQQAREAGKRPDCQR